MDDDFSPLEPVRIEISDTFDLHSVPPRDVAAIVEAYLEEAHRLGLSAIRIIHGRGIGVQRETVRKILARTPYVVEFSDAPAEVVSVKFCKKAGQPNIILILRSFPSPSC
jgi:dsDNA-specific endonuclease/ATPase MutS2